MTLLTQPQRNILRGMATARWVHLALGVFFLLIAAVSMFLEWEYTPRLADYLWTGACLVMAAAEFVTFYLVSRWREIFQEYL